MKKGFFSKVFAWSDGLAVRRFDSGKYHKNSMNKKLENPIVVALLAILFFLPNLGNVHLFDWDEINFAESAREMLLTGNYLRVQVDFQPFWEKPPLFIWLQTASMSVFGINEFAARFPNAVIGIVTLLTFFYIGKRLIDARFGFLWALAYLGSFTPHLYFKSGIIDPTFNYFMFLSVWFLYRTVRNQEVEASNQESRINVQRPTATANRSTVQFSFLAGLFAGLAVWTKGPVGIGIPTIVLGVIWAFSRFRPIITLKNLLVYGFSAGTISLGWMALLIYESSWQTFIDFVSYLYRLMATSEADHGEPIYYHFVVVLLGCFPISVIALRSLGMGRNLWIQKLWPTQTQPITTNDHSQLPIPNSQFANFMLALFWTVMVVFSLVKTKIVHYSSMAYFPLSFLAALYLYRWLKGEFVWPRWATVLLLVIGFLMSAVLTVYPLLCMYPMVFSSYINDDFAMANLQAPIEWAGWEWLIGVVYFGIIVCVSIVWNKRKLLAARLLLLSTAVCMFVYTAVVVPKVEGYSQRTVIDFYESKQGQDVYVAAIGYKSYAPLFYFKKPQHTRPEASNEDWLLNGPVDKPTYLVTRLDRADDYRYHPNLELIKEENGFVFFRRKMKF
jgi:4-amino-4-deoxy-L-arabinose transferase-like glycosyltransferase